MGTIQDVLTDALRQTLNMLINVCPSDFMGDSQLTAVIEKAEAAIKLSTENSST